MKKIISKTTSLFLALTACMFMSCNDVIFSTILDEVKLESAQVSGDINSIVRYTCDDKEYLYLDNGNIWRKDMTQTTTTTTALDGTTNTTTTNNPTYTAPYNGKWVLIPQNGMAEDHIIHLAADDTTLYALAGRTEKDSDTGYNVATSKTLYSSSDGGLTWKAVELKDAEGNAISMNLQATAAFTAKLFCTNAPQKAHRKAYIRISNITIYPYYSYVFELSGGTATRLETGTADLASTPTITTQSCAYFNGKTYFSSNAAITTDETLTTEAAHIYNGYSTIVQYSKDPEAETNPWTTTISTSTIYSLAYTKTHLLIGTADGLIYVTLDSTDSENTNLPKEKASITNASSTLSSYYRVFNVIAADPSAGALGCDIYASSVFSGSPSSTGASSDNIGLWAYYPGRANWNRE